MAKQVLTRLGDFSAMSEEDDDLVSNIRALGNLFVSIGNDEKIFLHQTLILSSHSFLLPVVMCYCDLFAILLSATFVRSVQRI